MTTPGQSARMRRRAAGRAGLHSGSKIHEPAEKSMSAAHAGNKFHLKSPVLRIPFYRIWPTPVYRLAEVKFLSISFAI